MNKSILVLSYYANMPGACQAEWVDDRINAFIKEGYQITLLSSIGTFKHNINNIKHIRVPTISPHGFLNECDEIEKRKITYSKPKKFLIIFYKLVCKFIYKILLLLRLKSGEGRWTWFISSSLVGMFHLKNHKFIYSTGGPASPHLTGILLSKLTGIKLIAELQDPLSGEDIGRNKFSGFGLKIIENFITNHANVILYCTKNAMLDAKKKYVKNAEKIHYVYPGSYEIINNNLISNSNENKIKITYLGSLYQTRNLDTLMSAIRLLSLETKSLENLIEINLYGNINPDIKERILNFELNIIKIHGLVSREIAMEQAKNADILLLIQNSDNRSIVTIPFKTYDYLHSGKLIFGLIYKNDELRDILIRHGHLACEVDDIEMIKNALFSLIFKSKSELSVNVKNCTITPEFASKKMIELVDEK